MRTRLTITTMMIASVTVLAACGDESAAGEQSQQNGLPHDGAPKVADPVDASAWIKKPCDVITNEQLNGAGFKFSGVSIEVKEVGNATTGPACQANWPSENGLSFAVNLQTPNNQGLSSYFAEQRAQHRYKIFKQLGAVDGHPTVQTAVDPKLLDPGSCDLEVGLNDKLTMLVSMTARKSKFSQDPCGAAKKVAGLAIETMKKGS